MGDLVDKSINQIEIERPLSPILHSVEKRKGFSGKSRRLSRTNKLFNINKNEAVGEDKRSEMLNDLKEDSFSVDTIEDEDLIACLNRLEEVEFNREIVYKSLVASDSDTCFKKPNSPAPKTPKRTKNGVKQEPVSLEIDNIRKQISKTNFRTASDKNIEINLEMVEKHSKLFDDILNCSQNEISRENKFNFLKKTQYHGFKGFDCQDFDKSERIKNKFCNSVLIRKNKIDSVTKMNDSVNFLRGAVENIDKFDTKRVSVKQKSSFSDSGTNKRIKMDLSQFSDEKMALKTDYSIENRNIEHNTINIEPPRHFVRKKEDLLPVSKKSNGVKEKLKYFDDLIGDNDDFIRESVSNASNFRKKLNFSDNLLKKNDFTLGTFASASGKSLQQSNLALNRSNSIFDEEKTGLPTHGQFSNHPGIKFTEITTPRTYSNDPVMKNDEKTGFTTPGKFSNDPGINNNEKTDFSLGTFTSASGKSLQLSNWALNRANSIFDDILQEKTGFGKLSNDPGIKNKENTDFTTPGTFSNDPSMKNDEKNGFTTPEKFSNDPGIKINGKDDFSLGTFTSASGKSLQPSNWALNRANSIFDDILQEKTGFGKLSNDPFIKNNDKTDFTTRGKSSNLPGINKNEKTAFTTPWKYSNATGIKKTDFTTPRKYSNDPGININGNNDFTTPGKCSNDYKTLVNYSNGPGITKTKRKLGISCLKQIPIENNKLRKASLIFDEDLVGISPIKPIIKNHSTPVRLPETTTTEPISNRKEKSINSNDLPNEITFDSMETMTDYEDEVRRLEVRLCIAKTRKDAMDFSKKEKLDCDKKPIEGVLYRAKKIANRKCLNSYVNNEKPGDEIDDRLSCITPQNAVNIHFKHFEAIARTSDGAVIVPNNKDLIGLYEIEIGFKAMPGVDPRLLRKNWVRNHYKWIIWKLASYERNFPRYFERSLTIDQVIQQLKYRYDREIDKAERSVIRRILEKDDAPQKRMILCVSGINRLGFNVFDLELTDGWYGVKTVVDEPLCYQISNKNIKVGCKLLICGAELINCEGCHPLEVTESTYLKINFNNTRRAVWHSRLGYQKNPSPIPISIRSIHHAGGAVARIDICIARCYPFRYLDKTGSKSTWLNERAEERRARQLDIEKYKQFERFERKLDTGGGENDEKMREEMEKLKFSRRESHPVKKLLVVDLNGSPMEAFNLFVWKPDEDLVQSLKENSCASVFNVYPKTNGDLHTGIKTMFETKSNAYNRLDDRFKRKLIRIIDLNDSKFSNYFNEFDTVGVVVRIRIDSNEQEIWLSDYTGRLLLIRVSEGPETCLLLDNLKRGQVVSVANLIYKGFLEKFELIKAVANHFTMFSSNPKSGHLREGLEDLGKDLPVDLEGLLRGCDREIGFFQSKANGVNDSDEDSTFISSRITSTDIALSLIDLDKFI
ncbi:uncharacterized protein LOC130443481 [Diorhabda sublineata]|uniref:uncharacterized protein LOC130443481 n=1 Tax=Diorhabda sublineata TaxID=1163346 RepID=UPI0024E1223E|nr:uncharacterized protein LOC130443481 [Diorhabda sublineata]